MADEEVKARLVIEKEGDSEAFQETAAGIDQLASSAGSAGGPVGQLAQQLGSLADSAGELGSRAQQSIKDFSSAIQEASSTDDLEKQREAIDRAAAALKVMGEEAERAGTVPKKALDELRATIEALEKSSERLSDPIKSSSSEAAAAVDRLKKTIDDGFKGSSKAVASARKAIDDYKASLDAAEKAGKGVTGPQAAELKRLEASYNSLTKEVGSFRAAQNQARDDLSASTKSVSNEVGAVNDLKDVLELAAPKWQIFIRGAASIVGAFTAGFVAGEKLRDLLNNMTDNAFDAWIKGVTGMQAAADAWVGGLNSTAQNLQLLANQKNIFDNLGLKGFTTDVEQNSAALDIHFRHLGKDRDALDEWLKSLGVSEQELREHTKELIKNVQEFQRAHPTVAVEGLEVFRHAVQVLLDDYAKLGKQVPDDLNQVAKSWGVVTSAVDSNVKAVGAARRDLDEQVKNLVKAIETVQEANQGLDRTDLTRVFKSRIQELIDAYVKLGVAAPDVLNQISTLWGISASAVEQGATRILDAIRGVSLKSRGQLESDAQSIQLAFSKINLQSLSFEQFTKARAEIQKVIDEFTAAGEKIPSEVARIGQQFSVFQSGIDLTVVDLQKIPEATEGAALGLKQVESAAETAQGAMKEAGASSVQFAGDFKAGTGSITDAANRVDDAGKKVGEAGNKTDEAGKKVGAAGEAIKDAGGEIASAAAGVAATSEKVAAAGDSAATASPKIKEAAEATKSLGSAAAGVSLSPLVGELSELEKAVKAIVATVGTELPNVFAAAGSKSAGFAAPFLAELDKIIKKSAEAKHALDQVGS